MFRPTLIRSTGLLAAAMLSLTAGAAAAQQNDDGPRSVVVKYGDLNLDSQAGARVMLARIRSAASRACGEAVDIAMLDRFALYSHCRTASIDQAVRALNAPLVTAMAGGQGAAETQFAQR